MDLNHWQKKGKKSLQSFRKYFCLYKEKKTVWMAQCTTLYPLLTTLISEHKCWGYITLDRHKTVFRVELAIQLKFKWFFSKIFWSDKPVEPNQKWWTLLEKLEFIPCASNHLGESILDNNGMKYSLELPHLCKK